MIETKEQHKSDSDEHYIECCTGVPWFNQNICKNLHGPIFEELFVTERQEIYDLMCGLHTYDNKNHKSTDAIKFGGERPLTEYSTINHLVSICVIIKFIEYWLNTLAICFAWHCCAYQ